MFGAEEDKESDVVSEAVTADMSAAMINYMPLRGAFSFGKGGVTREQMLALVDQLNSQA